MPAEQASRCSRTRIAGNNAPDVAYVNASDTADYAVARRGRRPRPTTSSRSDVVNPDDYVEAFKTFVTYEDKMWGLPMDGESTGLFYRTDMFEAAGIDGPPTTWEEFEAAAAALTDEDDGPVRLRAVRHRGGVLLVPVALPGRRRPAERGRHEIAFTSDEAKEAAEFYVGLTEVLAAGLPQLQLLRRPRRLRRGPGRHVHGRRLVRRHADRRVPGHRRQVGDRPAPGGPGGLQDHDRRRLAGHDGQTEVADAAWLWMEYLSQPEILAEWTYKTEGTLLPPLNSLLEGDEIVEEKPVLQGFIDLMKCGVASTVSNPKFPRIETILNEELGKAMYGEQSAEEALDNAAQQAEAILARWLSPSTTLSASAPAAAWAEPV